MKEFFKDYLFTKLNGLLTIISVILGCVGFRFAFSVGETISSFAISLSTNIIAIILTVSLVQYHLDKGREKDETNQELEKIMRFNRVVFILRGAYVRYFNCLVTPMDRRDELEINKICEGYQFVDLKDLYKPTLSLVDSFSVSSVERFFQAEEELRDYFLRMVENINFDYFPELREIILPFAQISLLFDMRHAIVGNKDIMVGNKRYVDNISEGIARNNDEHWVEKYEKKELDSNAMLPYVALYKMVQEEEQYLHKYDAFIDAHITKE